MFTMNKLEKLLYLENLSNKPVLSYTLETEEISSKNTSRLQNFISLLSHDATKFRKKVLINASGQEKDIAEFYQILIQKSPETLYFVKDNKALPNSTNMSTLRKGLKDFARKYEVCDMEIEKVINEIEFA